MTKKNIQCTVCNKSFDSAQALGGHMSTVHREPVNQVDPTEIAPHDEGKEEDAAVQIREHLAQGLNFEQLTKELGFKPTTVRREIAKEIVHKEKRMDNDEGSGFPMTIKEKELITPEGILDRLKNGSDDWTLRLEGMMLLRAAQRMNRDDIEMARMQAEADASRIKPILELMKETRLEQDAAAARAKESSVEIADRAAYEGARMLAEQMMPEVRALKSQTAGSSAPDPVTRMMNMMQALPRMMQMSQQLMGTMGMPMAGLSSQQPAQSPSSQSVQMTDEERASIFGGGA